MQYKLLATISWSTILSSLALNVRVLMPPKTNSKSLNVFYDSINWPNNRGDHLSPKMFNAAPMHPARFSTLVQGAVGLTINDIIKALYHKVTLQSVVTGCIVLNR